MLNKENLWAFLLCGLFLLFYKFIPPTFVVEGTFPLMAVPELKVLGGLHDSLATEGRLLEPGMISTTHKSGETALRCTQDSERLKFPVLGDQGRR